MVRMKSAVAVASFGSCGQQLLLISSVNLDSGVAVSPLSICAIPCTVCFGHVLLWILHRLCNPWSSAIKPPSTGTCISASVVGEGRTVVRQVATTGSSTARNRLRQHRE